MMSQMIDAVPNTVVLKQIKPLSALLLHMFLIFKLVRHVASYYYWQAQFEFILYNAKSGGKGRVMYSDMLRMLLESVGPDAAAKRNRGGAGISRFLAKIHIIDVVQAFQEHLKEK